MVLGIKYFDRLSRFDKAYEELDEEIQESVDKAIFELDHLDRLPNSRRLERVRSSKNAWKIRIDRGNRLTFEVSKNTCILRNVGKRNKVLKKP
ncbi:MAG: hypothetical protein OXH90_07165 [Paracoccaceae bacterium]|nr:hypothetical protein [Paracoccaceae bacterium]MDE2917712.1 hypothetical protein [Paracoccaceae bacterium]